LVYLVIWQTVNVGLLGLLRLLDCIMLSTEI
jgi:hypothetical protein